MKVPSFADAFEVLCLQAADDGRGDILFGDSVSRVRSLLRPFMVGEKFPDVYLESPLAGEPFLDVTVLYKHKRPGLCIASPVAVGMQDLLDWCAQCRAENEDVSYGFELDTKEQVLPPVAMHFQPRAKTELVRPFFEVLGEPERAQLYLDLAKRMPKGWPLSFFGLFRGRPGSPLRVCGYLADDMVKVCVQDAAQLKASFDEIGFVAYDDKMLEQASQLLSLAPGAVDFQFDLYPDGTLGKVFAFDIQFEIQQPECVKASFESGPVNRVFSQLQAWDIADERWRLVGDAAFARAVPAELDDGTFGRYAFTLMPQWAKVRWSDTVLQPSKIYQLGGAGLMKQ